MTDENLLKQLQNSLIQYQETQETLDIVVQNAQFAFGEEWLEKLPVAFDNVQMDTAQKIILKDKANHVVHYYGALAAWQEASTYLSSPNTVTAQQLAERIPTLEYWLALFGNEGTNLVAQVKELYRTLYQTEEVKENEQAEVLLSTTAETEEAEVLNPEQSVVAEPIAQEGPVIETSVQPDVLTETQPLLQTIQPESSSQAQDVRPEALIQQNQQQQPDVEQEQIIQIIPETFREPETSYQPEVEETEGARDEEEVVSEITEEVVLSEPQTMPDVLVEEQPVWQDKNTAGEMALEDLVDFNAPTSVTQVPTEEFINPKEVMQGETQMVTQNWDLANFLRQKRLYDDANNWLSAWCIRMDNSEKTDYPHYGFIVDIMHDLKEKIQTVLENQLLEELVEREIPGGQDAMKRLLSAIEKELDDLPDDFKISTAEKIKLSAREILGAMDNSQEKEFIGPAPDGFELMDDPYAASTEQILSDFEKAEEEVQNQIDKLNVIEENENKQEKD